MEHQALDGVVSFKPYILGVVQLCLLGLFNDLFLLFQLLYFLEFLSDLLDGFVFQVLFLDLGLDEYLELSGKLTLHAHDFLLFLEF